MTIKLYTFRFSPPARLAHLVAKMIEVDHHQVEVDLSKVMMIMMMMVMMMTMIMMMVMMMVITINRHIFSNVGSNLTLHSQDKKSSNFPG